MLSRARHDAIKRPANADAETARSVVCPLAPATSPRRLSRTSKDTRPARSMPKAPVSSSAAMHVVTTDSIQATRTLSGKRGLQRPQARCRAPHRHFRQNTIPTRYGRCSGQQHEGTARRQSITSASRRRTVQAIADSTSRDAPPDSRLAPPGSRGDSRKESTDRA